ncbi:hypothetical protein MKX01_012586 [Papaver californicum]|nr:hypothetical protein MKX01_012586 [Papaver californicum]
MACGCTFCGTNCSCGCKSAAKEYDLKPEFLWGEYSTSNNVGHECVCTSDCGGASVGWETCWGLTVGIQIYGVCH